MLKKALLVVMSVLVLLMVAGCGEDKVAGDWLYKGKNKALGGESVFVLHIEKADNGDYLLTREVKSYRRDYYYLGPRSLDEFVIAKDGALNSKEVFTWKKGYFGMVSGKWNGNILKLGRKYELSIFKNNNVEKIKKDEITLKDGKLLYDNDFYEKSDKAKIDKAMSDWKELLKKDLGKEMIVSVPHVTEKVNAVIAKVIIKENGKEEVFE